MNEGARRANDQMRHHGERSDRETTIKLLREIRDSLKNIDEMLSARIGWIIPYEDGDLEVPELPPSDEGELLEMNDPSEPELLPDPPIIPKRITPDIVPTDDGGFAQKAQPPPKEDI